MSARRDGEGRREPWLLGEGDAAPSEVERDIELAIGRGAMHFVTANLALGLDVKVA